MPAIPTILVKRADGTTARMTLDEIKKLRARVQTQADEETPRQLMSQRTQTLAVMPLIIRKRTDLSDGQTAPVASSREQTSSLTKRDPAPSPLEETVADSELKHKDAIGSVSYNETVKKILRTAGVTVPTELSARAESLVISVLKGVRDNEQFRAQAFRPIDQGGMGWSANIAASVLAAAQVATRASTRVMSPLTLSATQSAASSALSNVRPVTQSLTASTTRSLATSAPVKDIFIDEARASFRSKLAEPAQRPFSPSKKDMIHDVQPAQKPENGMPVVMGPVEEMKTFGIKDWRRLGATPSDAGEALFAKFQGWKDESFLLYLDARNAWRQSPLMRDYRELVANSINSSSSLRETITVATQGKGTSKDNISEADVVAIIEINGRLTV